MNNDNRLKTAHANVDAAIKSSHDHEKKLKLAVTSSILVFAAMDIGNAEPLNKLFKGVSGTDAETVRLFMVTLRDKHGIRVTGDDGKEKIVSFFAFDRTSEKFVLNKSADETTIKHVKAMRKAIEEGGENLLSEISFGRQNRADRAARDFDPIGAVHNLLKRLTKEGDKALALSLNRVLGQDAMPVGDLDEIAKNADPMTKLAAAQKALDEAKAKADKAAAKLAELGEGVPAVEPIEGNKKVAA